MCVLSVVSGSPPTASLSSLMELENCVSNLSLAHEIVVNRDFCFKPQNPSTDRQENTSTVTLVILSSYINECFYPWAVLLNCLSAAWRVEWQKSFTGPFGTVFRSSWTANLQTTATLCFCCRKSKLWVSGIVRVKRKKWGISAVWSIEHYFNSQCICYDAVKNIQV